MGRKKTRPAMRSHLHDERESPHPQPSRNANPKPNPNPNPAGAEHTPSGNHVISISGEREKQKKKKKEKSSSYKLEPISVPSPDQEWGVSSPSPKRLEDERQGSKGLQSDGLQSDTEMSTGEIEPSIGTRKSKKVKNKKHFQMHPCHWCFNRRALWNFFLLQSQTRRPRRIRVIFHRRFNKITKTDGSKYLENQSQASGSKRRKTDKTADVRDSSVSVQSESESEPENDSSVPRLPTDPMSEPEDDGFEDYCKSRDIQLLWRPPKPEEHDIWIPSRVTTNGQGRGLRLRYGYGETLVEIFNIEVDLSGRPKTRGTIYGTITLHCTVYKIVIFNRDKKSALMIDQKGYLPLKGSDVAPLGVDRVGIFVDLKIDDDELCEDVVVWDPCYSKTDKWLWGTLEGRNGFVNVTFAVMKQAWLAEIDVKLIKSTKEVCSKIYGDIVVYIDNMSYLRYFAFSKGCNDYSIVKPQESIPLSRSLFTCRCGSSLVVKVNLWDSDTKESLACGALLFPPEYYGDSVGKVSGLLGMVEVKVNWVFYMDHSKTGQALHLDRYTKTKET